MLMLRCRFHPPLPLRSFSLPPLLLVLLFTLSAIGAFAASPAAPQPLYRDPVYDGAADPVVIWNPGTQTWWMFYTNRRANVPGLSGVAWVHDTRVSIAESRDRGITWTRVGDAAIDLPPAVGSTQPTQWAPEVLTGPDGTHHMYLTVVPGVFEDWQHPRHIVHLTSADLRHWTYRSTLALFSDRVIDAGVARLPDGTWRLWYNNERDGKSIYFADSPDLYHWTDRGKATGVGERPGEGPCVFHWRGSWWMLVDLWRGLGVYRSDNLIDWTPQPDNLLGVPGLGRDDGVNGGHPGVVVCGDRAYLFYFTHPGRAGTIRPDDPDELDRRRSSIQVTELRLDETGALTCDRNAPTFIDLVPPPALESDTHNPSVIGDDAFSGSSINTPPGYNQSLTSNATHQFAGYYRPDGTLVIARRSLDSPHWSQQATSFRANVADAHNAIALGIDGAGGLHLAWGHHNIPLQYARTAPGGATAPRLTFATPESLIGRHESSVTYPQFLPLPDGDLVLVHRDGGSGRGNFVLNHYDRQTATWSRLHDNLLDGEGVRSAYPSFFTDRFGTLHLAWTWRETPDVATNHDLAYARSHDGGRTWSDAENRPLAVPFSAASEAYVARIPMRSTLMNPPAVSADDSGRPLIANYWQAAGEPAPQYYLLHHVQGSWRRHRLFQNTLDFELAGGGTKRPAFSRSVIAATGNSVTVAFRHDAFGGAPLLAHCDDLLARQPRFDLTVLPTGDLDAWEPTADVAALHRSGHLDMLVQPVQQRDGNDQAPAHHDSAPLQLWSLDL